MSATKDLSSIDDIKWLVDTFYGKVRADALLSPMFSLRIGNDWEPHLQTMYKFWNMAIFGVHDYVGNPFSKHITLPLEGEHFARWLTLFFQTLEEGFQGPVADDTRRKANGIAQTFQARLHIQPTTFNNDENNI